MRRDSIPAELARLITARALRAYAQGLGWQPVDGINGNIAVFHRPDSKLHQLIVPVDEGMDDYGAMIAEAVAKLADYEKRPVQDVLDHLLLPPSDLLQFQDSGQHAGDGTIPLAEAVDLIAGAHKALLAQAHSVIQPRPFHPRLSRGEAERFVDACRLAQTRRGSFMVVLACPLDAIPTEQRLFEQQEPFTRRVTASLMETLTRLANAADQEAADELVRPGAIPLLSANLCEALLQMCPEVARPNLTVRAVWSRAALPPPKSAPPSAVNLQREAFAVAAYLATRLRSAPQPVSDRFIGYVDVLRGQPGPDDHPAGEVMLTIFQSDEIVKAWLDLNTTDYAAADRAHMANIPVAFSGVLHRSPRIGRVSQVNNFRLLDTQAAAPAPSPEPVPR
jgi:hypothetical protein